MYELGSTSYQNSNNTITNTNRLLLCWAVFFACDVWAVLCLCRVSNIKYYTIKMQTPIKRQTNTNNTSAYLSGLFCLWYLKCTVRIYIIRSEITNLFIISHSIIISFLLMIIQTSTFEDRNDQMIRFWLNLLIALNICAAHLEQFATAHDLFHILLSHARL